MCSSPMSCAPTTPSTAPDLRTCNEPALAGRSEHWRERFLRCSSQLYRKYLLKPPESSNRADLFEICGFRALSSQKIERITPDPPVHDNFRSARQPKLCSERGFAMEDYAWIDPIRDPRVARSSEPAGPGLQGLACRRQQGRGVHRGLGMVGSGFDEWGGL